jgi:hypothetical protein
MNLLPNKQETPSVGAQGGSQNTFDSRVSEDGKTSAGVNDHSAPSPTVFNPQVSMLAPPERGQPVKPEKNLPIRDMLEAIRGSDYATQIADVRATPDDAARKKLKARLPSFTASGVFNGAIKGEDPDIHSGLVQLDFDLEHNRSAFANGVESMRDKLASDPYVFTAFLSPSGGVKVLARIPSDNQLHRRAFEGLVLYVKKNYSLVADATGNPNRLCYVSHDPELRINEDAVPFAPAPAVAPVQSNKPVAAPTTGKEYSIEEVRRALKSIPKRPPYDMWVKIANAVRDAVGFEAAEPLLKDWSPEERPGEYRAKAKELDRVTAGTLFHKAREHGYFPETYYENHSSRYYARDANDAFRSYTAGHAADVLRHYRTPDAEIDPTMFRIRRQYCFDLVLNVAGMARGLHQINGISVLVPVGPKYISPKRGEWPIIHEILVGALGQDQFEWFLHWLASSTQSYYSQIWQPAQVVAFIGPTGSCKSLIQGILTAVFGGREARVMQALTGATTFNGEWAEATHLVVEDEFAENSKRLREQVKEKVKATAVNKWHRIHPKGRTAMSLSPFWRMTISCNPVTESLAVLPILDDSVANKISLLWTSRLDMPMPAETPDEKALLWAKIESEFPALIYHLLELKTVPESLRDPEGRFTIKAHHHPTAKEQIDRLTPEGELLQNIFESIAETIAIEFTGTAAQLLALLECQNREGQQTEKSLGRNLSRYAQTHPSRVKIVKKSNSHRNVYEINRPYDSEEFI